MAKNWQPPGAFGGQWQPSAPRTQSNSERMAGCAITVSSQGGKRPIRKLRKRTTTQKRALRFYTSWIPTHSADEGPRPNYSPAQRARGVLTSPATGLECLYFARAREWRPPGYPGEKYPGQVPGKPGRSAHGCRNSWGRCSGPPTAPQERPRDPTEAPRGHSSRNKWEAGLARRQSQEASR